MATSLTTIFINGKTFQANGLSPKLSLNEFIRNQTPYKGTKVSCNEGGCGVCTVLLIWTDADNTTKYRTINSCLRPAVACDGMHVLTVESIGSARMGYNAVQERIANENGTQCGFCTPGMVMNTIGVLTNNPTPSAEDLQKAFDGNLCRCTGYRSILAAIGSFAPPTSTEHDCLREHSFGTPDRTQFKDIEDNVLCCGNYAQCTPDVRNLALRYSAPRGYVSTQDGLVWVDINSLQALAAAVVQYQSVGLRFVVGNTSVGVEKFYPIPAVLPKVYLNVRPVPEFHLVMTTEQSFSFGAAVTISEVIDAVEALIAAKKPLSQHFPMFLAHLKRIAHHSVRNIGSLVGNLVLAYHHKTSGDSFPSDALISLFGLGATIFISDVSLKQMAYSIEDFLALPNLNGLWVQSVSIPFASATTEVYRSYKTALRRANSHALVNAAMKANVVNGVIALPAPVLAFGGVQASPVNMFHTAAAMIGTSVTDTRAFQSLCSSLRSELNADPSQGRTEYRVSLSLSYFYKFYLALQPSLSQRLALAAEPWIERPVSSGTQTFQPHPTEAPVGEPITKLSGLKQASGEAQYTDDVSDPAGTLRMAFVRARVGTGTISRIDATAALASPGVVAFYSAGDFPRNHWCGHGTPETVGRQGGAKVDHWGNTDPTFTPLFAETEVTFHGQAIGIILADSESNAQRASDLVNVDYSTSTPGILSISDAIKANSLWPIDKKALGLPVIQGSPDSALSAAKTVLMGTATAEGQYHFYMETQTALAIPSENDGITLYHATQQPQIVQQNVALMLGLPQSKVDVRVKRLGGGYGGKLEGSTLIGTVTSMAAWKSGTPVKCRMSIEECMEMLGGRSPHQAEYKIGLDENNNITVVEVFIYVDGGFGFLFGSGVLQTCCQTIDNCYKIPNWKIDGAVAKTNLPFNCAMRGPGWVPAVYIMEYMMNHTTTFLNYNVAQAAQYRQQHFYQQGDTSPTGDQLKYFNIPKIWSQIQSSSSFTAWQTEVDSFNATNLWRKRGLALVPVKFGVGYGENFTILITVYPDGSVLFNTGGVEMGQGLETKVAQVIAQRLHCPLESIASGTNSTAIHNVNQVSGGSISSELCCLAAINACGPISQNLSAARKALPNNGQGASWLTVVQKAASLNLDLSAKASSNSPGNLQGSVVYNSYLAAIAEVEVDCLTGESNINRCDILYDCGYSLNPKIDIGQIEGAFTMGIGYYLNEEKKFVNGKLFNSGTWEYKPPSALDIPVSLNISLLRDTPNPNGVLSSKAVGEPPLCASCVVLFSAGAAVQASLKDRSKSQIKALDCPSTVDILQLFADISDSDFVLE